MQGYSLRLFWGASAYRGGVVIARGVNSLTTVTEVETADLQKIKINAIQDQIEGDIYSTINKSYIGNYSNSYDNKCLLITAIKGYLRGLEATEGGKGWLKADTTTATPEVEVEDNASPTISEVESRVHRLGNVRALTRAEVDDQATEKVERITQRIKDLTKKVFSPVIKLKDLTVSTVGKIKQRLKEIATTFTPIVKIRDLHKAVCRY